jgi:hypothetical protein
MDYTHAMLARLAHAAAAQELSEQLISEGSADADGYGRGAFLTEEAHRIYSDTRSLLAAAVVADRLRGASWAEVGDALGITRQSAHERFGDAEREFREAVLFPHRQPGHGGRGYCAAPYAVEQPDVVRERLDRWVVENRRSSGPDRTEPEPFTRGLAAMRDGWTMDRMGEVLRLSEMLIDRKLPTGVTYEQARWRHAELKVELYERMTADRPDDTTVALQLMASREDLAGLDTEEHAAR